MIVWWLVLYSSQMILLILFVLFAPCRYYLRTSLFNLWTKCSSIKDWSIFRECVSRSPMWLQSAPLQGGLLIIFMKHIIYKLHISIICCWSYLWSTSSTYYVFQPYTDQGSPHDRGLPVATRKTTWSYWKIPGKFFYLVTSQCAYLGNWVEHQHPTPPRAPGQGWIQDQHGEEIMI